MRCVSVCGAVSGVHSGTVSGELLRWAGRRSCIFLAGSLTMHYTDISVVCIYMYTYIHTYVYIYIYMVREPNFKKLILAAIFKINVSLPSPCF
jgi:hypothetical protein